MSQPADHDTLPPSQDPAAGGVREPPRALGGIVRQLGPGLIIAGSIVGSGELIATTKTGAQAGISLLWLVLIGCVIKVFVQVELGRYTISYGETTLSALDRVPGPRLRVNWIVWFWLAMMLVGIGQLGGIVGGVGQALALSFPLKGDYAHAIAIPSQSELVRYINNDDTMLSEWDLQLASTAGEYSASIPEDIEAEIELDSVDVWMAQASRRASRQLQEFQSALPNQTAKVTATAGKLFSLEDDLSAAMNTSSADDAGVQQLREKIHALGRQLDVQIVALNASYSDSLSPAALDDNSSLRAIHELSDGEQTRVQRGHVILSRQLRRLNEDDLRAATAMLAVQQSHEAQTRFDELQAAGAGDEALVEAEREVDDREGQVAALLEPATRDDKYWAAVVAVFTAMLLYRGRYNLIQNVSMTLVVSFTFITVGNVLSLQSTAEWHISAAELWRGISFGWPEASGGKRPIATALATFGIIGVGASELIAYPYWCLEKGYAKYTGLRSPDENWARRARGWMKVMHYDALLSMFVYTIATMAFFVMGVAVLYNEGRDPDGMRMVSTLAMAYVPVFGEYARWLFLSGAVAVLYSTFMVANAQNARMYTDAFKLYGFMSPHNQKAHDRSIGILSVVLPLLCLAVFCSGVNPVAAILVSGTMQALLLPMIGVGALYFRYTRTDERLKPSLWWDVLLVLSCLGLLVAGGWGAYSRLF